MHVSNNHDWYKGSVSTRNDSIASFVAARRLYLAGRDVATLRFFPMLALSVDCKHRNAPLLHRGVYRLMKCYLARALASAQRSKHKMSERYRSNVV